MGGYMKKSLMWLYFILISCALNTFADTGAHSGHSLIGQPGNPAQVSRTIEIKMIENRFLPHEITIRQGETIRFLVKNEGKKHHEFTIDTIKNLKEHAKMMRAHPDMLHNEPNQLKVAPGEQKELIWHFTETGIVDFACPYPGHFKGMQGKIYVEKK
ncbi:MAG: cupredoxin family protein [Nitrosomonas sp.]|nr:cupredoxin family protein [Nitrosomonas sp.]MBK7365949.1 cupredoxin family protein [Nitrosomonas sp.]